MEKPLTETDVSDDEEREEFPSLKSHLLFCTRVSHTQSERAAAVQADTLEGARALQ